jgi:two-component system response regulator PilR (NtrC family)
MTLRSALIVDDERDIRELLVLTLGRMGIRVDTAADIASARSQLAAEKYDLCLTDMRLPDGNGLEIVSHISQRFPDTPVAMITAFGNVEAAVEALKAGAFDFVTKPVDLSVLRRLVSSALSLGEQRRVQQPVAARIVGDSARMQSLRAMILKVARSQAPVYIAGESGVGKELVARLIHEQGARSSGPFVPVNCGAIPAELMESELFGHKKGSFTGAHADKDGLFQAANGGTLFLDEVAELPLQLQVKLLRVIQEKSVRPVGGASEIPLDVRILSATHKNLAALVEEGRFRHDLYYRINVIELPVPSLRQRREDIPQLVEAILQRLAAEMGEGRMQLSEAALDALRAYPFPGNVRELENILERAMALCEGERIDVADLALPEASASSSRQAMTAASAPAAEAAAPAAADQDAALPDALLQLEREKIRQALEACRYNKTRTAAHLGITFRALRYKLKKLEME